MDILQRFKSHESQPEAQGGRPGKKLDLEKRLWRRVARSIDEDGFFLPFDGHIPWDKFDSKNPGWILNDLDPIGAHDWYKALEPDEKIRLGLVRAADTMLRGLVFERWLKMGINNLHIELTGTPEGSDRVNIEDFIKKDEIYSGPTSFNYLKHRMNIHEDVEEGNHELMFWEMANLISEEMDLKTKGVPLWARKALPLIMLTSNMMEEVPFWMLALSGEEPIDHTQRALDKGRGLDGETLAPAAPVLKEVIHTHIVEEARHIQYAEDRLRAGVPKQNAFERGWSAFMMPMAMSEGANLIMKPTRHVRRNVMGIPNREFNQMFWGSEASQRIRRGYFDSMRSLAVELDIKSGEGEKSKKTIDRLIGDASWKLFALEPYRAPEERAA